MKIPVLLAILAAGAVVILAGAAVASGSGASILGNQGTRGGGHGMMGSSDGYKQTNGQTTHHQYMHGGGGSCPCWSQTAGNCSWDQFQVGEVW